MLGLIRKLVAQWKADLQQFGCSFPGMSKTGGLSVANEFTYACTVCCSKLKGINVLSGRKPKVCSYFFSLFSTSFAKNNLFAVPGG